MKKIMSFFLSLCILVSFICIPAYAQTENLTILTKDVPQQARQYGISKLNLLLTPVKDNPQSYGFEDYDLENLSIGQGFEIYNMDNNTIKDTKTYCFPLISKNEVKGILSVYSVNGEYSAKLSKSFADNLTALKNGEKVVIAKKEKTLYAIGKNESYFLSQNESLKTVEELKNNSGFLDVNDNVIDLMNNKEFKSINIIGNQEKIKNRVKRDSGSGYVSKVLPVEIVRQVDSNGRLQPWCWAATCAALTNYLRGTSLTAQSVHDDYPTETGRSISIMPTIFMRYNVYAQSRNTLSWIEVQREIGNNCPMYTSFKSSTGGHAMSLIGYTADYTGGKAYTVIDPNQTYYEEVTASNNGSGITYNLDGVTYTWRYSLTLK